MKTFLFSILALTITFSNLKAQTPAQVEGAWTFNEDEKLHYIFFQDGFYFHTIQQGNQFIGSDGGNYEVNNKVISTRVLFNSMDSTKIGNAIDVPFSFTGNQLSISVSQGQVNFQRVDEGQAPLAGVWRITGRMQDGKITPIHQTGSRQTYKLLTGSKFQWVAMDPEKKQFSGTGGGSYTFKDGKYTEHIEFFSRDNSRVGASLNFDGKLENGDWHHSGLSSKGAKIYEIWSRIGKAN
ncbi:membrane or secreted protein [Pedobacter nyackensis]|nr:membrane or secreted protein [Pedobacter nyackensis]